MIDVKRQMFSFRLTWLGMILNNTNGIWKDMSQHWFDCLGGLHLLMNCIYTNDALYLLKLSNVPHFYIKILRAWCLIKNTHQLNVRHGTVLTKIYYGIIKILF